MSQVKFCVHGFCLFGGDYVVDWDGVYFLTSRVPLQIDIRRDRNQLSSINAQGLVENNYIIKITNKTQQNHDYAVTLTPQPGLKLDSRFKTIPLEAGESYDFPVSVLGDPKWLPKAISPSKCKWWAWMMAVNIKR